MSCGIADHVVPELHPGVRVHPCLRLPDADAYDGTRYAIGEEQALERDGAHQARRAEDAVFGRPANRSPECVGSAANRFAGRAVRLGGVGRIGARRQLPRGASPNEYLRDDKGPRCAPDIAPFASA